MANDIKLAKGLGWLSIGLGVAELIAFRRMGRLVGIGKPLALIRLFGAREVANGLAVLRSPSRATPMWGRVAGDVMDAALIALGGLTARCPNRRFRVRKSLAATLAIGALDVACAAALQRRARRRA